MELIQLFWSFFQIGLFSIGGGYAAMPLIQQQVVELHPWLTMTQFADIMTIAEMTPGPIAINSATFVGIQVAGIPGALVATLGCVMPSCVIVLTLAYVCHCPVLSRRHCGQCGDLGGVSGGWDPRGAADGGGVGDAAADHHLGDLPVLQGIPG